MNQIPNAELFFLKNSRSKELVRKSTAEMFKGRSVLVVGINGAFTPTDEKMVKDYEKLFLHFKDTTIIGDPNDATHIDDIYFLCMNDAYVMDAWWKKMKIKNCKYLPDGNGALSLRINNQGGIAAGQGVVEMYNKGLGKRTWRYVLLVEDNCQMTFLEEEVPDGAENRNNLDIDPYILTEPEETLAFLRARQQKAKIEESNRLTEDLSLPS
tara:strand:- start:512 stop:1144 length:633 start_codon:yes stop_codon:yes gene_type:complete